MMNGWGWPANSKKPHYFVGATSLCRKWMFAGRLDPDTPKHGPEDCAVCVKALANLQRCPACGSEASSKKPTWCDCNATAPFKRVPLSVSAVVDAILPR